MSARVLIAGCGYVGSALAERLVADGLEVFGLRRKPLSLPPGVRAIGADLADPASLDALPDGIETVFYLASPAGSEDALYRRAYVDGLRTLLSVLDAEGQRPRRLLFASSTAVYAQDGGAWVDEESETRPDHFSGRRLLEGEGVALGAGCRGVVVRFGGIYGPRRTRLLDRVRAGSATYREDPPLYTNRIHRDDCAGVLRHLSRLEDPAPVYLGVDADPANQRDVMRWLAGALGAPEPRPSRDAAKGARGNKRCRNRRLVESGYPFRYPTFREGYRAVIEELV